VGEKRKNQRVNFDFRALNCQTQFSNIF